MTSLHDTNEPAVRTHALTKRFGAKVAVDAVTFDVEAGLVFGLIGPNGAGKTTTFSILAGMMHPSDGRAEILGFVPTAVDVLRGRLGVLPQDALLPPAETVGEFLIHMALLQGLPKKNAVEAGRQALADVSGGDWWQQRCGALSHGMAKRVALAQAFLGEPEVVLLDEPTAGVDPRGAWEIRNALRSKKGRCTIVVSSHNLQELEELCDAAAILDRGRVLALGTMAELTAANEEVCVKVAPGTMRGSATGQVPVEALRELRYVKAADLDEGRLEIVVTYNRMKTDGESVIADVLGVLLKNQVRISGLTKGRGLERRVVGA